MRRWIRHAAALGVLSLALPMALEAQASERDQARFAVADVAEEVLPAVVSIRTMQELHIEDIPPIFRFLYPQGGLPDEVRQGEGSGVLLSEDGLVVTNNHVVAAADKVYVQTHDGTEYVASVVAADVESDLAVIQLATAEGGPVSGLPTLDWGDSEALRLGEVVLAVGNPFGLSGTVTMGIISAKSRETESSYAPFLQTDAAINPGNSGGALVDMDGHLVGINTQILSPTGGNLGIGFAIPSSYASRVVKDLLQGGKVAKGWLGVHIQDLSPELADAWGYGDDQQGVLLTDIEEGSPADKAGLKRSDLVTHVGGKEVTNTAELARSVGLHEPGARVEVRLLRKGKEKALPVVLGERPGSEEAADEATVTPAVERIDDLPVLEGLELAGLDAEVRARYNVSPRREKGVMVLSVASRTPASRARLEEGDLILEVNSRPVNSGEDVREAVQGLDEAVLLIARGEQTLFVMVRAEGARP